MGRITRKIHIKMDREIPSGYVSSKRRTTRTLRGYTGRNFIIDVNMGDLMYITEFEIEEMFEGGFLDHDFQSYELALQWYNQGLMDEVEFEEEMRDEEEMDMIV